MDSVDLESKHHNCSPPHRRHLPPPPPHHHHHQFSYISPHCPHHSYLLRQKNHSQSCPFFTSRSSPQNTEPFAFVQSQTHRTLQGSECNETENSSLMTRDEIKKLEPEEEEEPIFVLTDEWKEFFAKSEAKRRLAKKQAKKKGKN